MIRQALDANEQALRTIYRAVPRGTTCADAMKMPWSAERNLALRKALAVAFPSDDVVMVNAGDVIQCVHKTKARADASANILRADLTGWHVDTTKRPDRAWLVTCYRDA